MITKVRFQAAKTGRNAGRKMAFVTLEDLHGQIEIVIFTNELEKFQGFLRPEAVVFVKGEVDRRRQEPSLRVREIVPLEEADERLSAMVVIRLTGAVADPEFLRSVREVIRRYRGDRPVFLAVVTAEGVKVTIRTNPECNVRPGKEFVREIDALLGPGHLDVLAPMRSTPAAYVPPPPAEREDVPTEEADTETDSIASLA